MPYRKPIDEERVSRGPCKRCGVPVIRARVGLTMALDVVAEAVPVIWEEPGPLYWCWTGKRLLWRSPEHARSGRCNHTVYADHQCEESMSEEDPFGVDAAPRKPSSPYAAMLHPVSGKVIGRHVRVTNFIKGLTDDFGLQQWQRRMVARGLAGMPDELTELQALDVKRNASRIDEICATAKRAAGGDEASSAGTHLHKQTELADLGYANKLDENCLDQLYAYRDALNKKGITIIPELIERKVCHTGLSSLVTGTFDRIVRLSDGSYAVLDVKTGSLDTEKYLDKWLSIAAQLVIYQQAAALHGVWDPETKAWQEVPRIRDDLALVAHLPAGGASCVLYEVPLDVGRKALQVLDSLRMFRRTKPVVVEYEPRTVVSVADLVDGWLQKGRDEIPFLIDTAVTVSNLMALVQRAKDAGVWNQQLSDAARLRHKQITERA